QAGEDPFALLLEVGRKLDVVVGFHARVDAERALRGVESGDGPGAGAQEHERFPVIHGLPACEHSTGIGAIYAEGGSRTSARGISISPARRMPSAGSARLPGVATQPEPSSGSMIQQTGTPI